jgi:GTP-binding protein Era
VGTKLAIVSDKPQTTRNRIVGVRHAPGAQIVFVDTPGIHRPLHRMNVRMVDLAVQSMSQSDAVCAVVDASEAIGGGDQHLAELLRRVNLPIVLALNKIDVMEKPRLLPVIAEWSGMATFADIVPVSALTGEQVDRLEEALAGHLPEGEPLYPPDYVTDQPERFYVAEIVREKVLQHTRHELPFATAVLVDHMLEPDERGLMRISCTVFVERESQKAIVVGHGGAMIKRIGTEARAELEVFFGARVFLDLRVGHLQAELHAAHPGILYRRLVQEAVRGDVRVGLQRARYAAEVVFLEPRVFHERNPPPSFLRRLHLTDLVPASVSPSHLRPFSPNIYTYSMNMFACKQAAGRNLPQAPLATGPRGSGDRRLASRPTAIPIPNH